MVLAEAPVNVVDEPVQPLAGASRDGEGVGSGGLEDLKDGRVFEPVDLIEEQDGGFVAALELVQDGFDGGDVPLDGVVGQVGDVEKQVGVDGFFESSAERCDEVVGQVADEPDGIAEQDGVVVGELPLAGAGVEGGEQVVGHVYVGVGEGVEQAAFSGVGIADDGDGERVAAGANLA